MAKYKAKFTLILTEDEVTALREFLGNMTGDDWTKAANECEVTKGFVTDIYHALPDIRS